MKEQEKVFRELKKVTRELIRCGLAEEYNYPVIQQMDIVWEKYQNISLYLRNMDYSTIYDEIEKNHNYNVKLPDGGIIQLMIRINGHIYCITNENARQIFSTDIGSNDLVSVSKHCVPGKICKF